MAFERLSDKQTLGSDLGSFVEAQLGNYTRQLAIRNAEDEARFNRLVLEEDLPLDGQLEFRQKQLERVADDPEETKRIRNEISTLKDRVQQKEYSDAYLDKLIEFESGHSSLESVVGFLRERLANTTDENVKASIRKSLSEQENNLFTLRNNVLQAQTTYALQDKRVDVLDGQIEKVAKARANAVLADNQELTSLYDLQLQSLKKARNEAAVENVITGFSVGAMSGYQSATALLDSYNNQISNAAADGPITVGGTRFDSPKQFWTFKRDSYLADDSANGFFPRMNTETKEMLNTKRSSNALTNNDVAASKSAFDNLAGRPELQSYTQKINTYRQDALQHGVDLMASAVSNAYTADLDVNKAFRSLEALKTLGGNVSETETKILSEAASLKETQVGNLLQTAQQLMKEQPGLTPEKAIQQAAATGAAIVMAPNQLVDKTETAIANDFTSAAQGGQVQNDPRTTAGAQPTKAATAGAAPTAPQINDLSDRYGQVGRAIYDKTTGQAFTNENDFFRASGMNSFQNLKFDTAYQPPVQGASPQLQNQPQPNPSPSAPAPAATPAPVQPNPTAPVSQTYRVRSGDTLSAISQKFLGDASRAKEIAAANKIADPNRINVDQELVIPNR